MTARAPETVGAWLEQLTPEPPAALVDRLDLALRPHASRAVGDLPDACLAAGETVLKELLRAGSTSREGALDLLTVDALITYAFEAAAAEPQLLVDRANSAMQRIASLPPAGPPHAT